MTVIARLDRTQVPAVVVDAYDYGGDEVPQFMVPPDYVDVTNVDPLPVRGFTYDGTTWAPGVLQQRAANRAALHQRAAAALAANGAYLAIAQPTSAQVIAQQQALTRQVNALIRLTLGSLDSTGGT